MTDPSTGMAPATAKAAANAIDAAIEATAEAEFARLAAGLGQAAKRGLVERAVDETLKLRAGKQPVYQSECVPLLYLLQYQAKQINLVYSIVKRMIFYRRATSRSACALITRDSGMLRIIDVGCGALATQFAATLAAADAIEAGERIAAISVASRDNSRAMPALGWKMWRAFKSAVKGDPALGSLREAIARIRADRFDLVSAPFPEARADEDCWVTAIHALYDDNKKAVADSLAQAFAANPDPNAAFLTTHNSKKSLMRGLGPFDKRLWTEFPQVYEHAVRIPDDYPLRRTAEWWTGLQRKLGLDKREGAVALQGAGYWSWADAACRLYLKPGRSK